MFCTSCGAKVNEGQGFCTSCGARLTATPARLPEIPRAAAPANKSSLPTGAIVAIVAGVLILFLGIVSAIAIPNLLRARQIANLKGTVSDIRQMAMALEGYITDNARLPDLRGRYQNDAQFQGALVPFYVKALPFKDRWGHDYYIYFAQACEGQYGLSGAGEVDYLIVSLGKNGIRENWEYSPSSPDAGLYVIGSMNDYDRDLVWYSGSWIRAPQGYN